MTNAAQEFTARRWFCFSRLTVHVLSFCVSGGEELISHERDDRQRQQQRYEDCDGERDRQRCEKLADYAFQQSQRQEDNYGC